MKNALVLLAVVALAGCLSPARYDAKYEAKFCEEWEACNPDFACDLAELDYSDCDFDRKAAKDCLDGQWVCNKSNSAFHVVQTPASCEKVYTSCTNDTGPTGTTPTTTDTGTTTSAAN